MQDLNIFSHKGVHFWVSNSRMTINYSFVGGYRTYLIGK